MKKILLLLLLLILLIIIFRINKKEKFTNMYKKESTKKIIAFSLWGKNECYNWGAVENALLAEKIYPDWICRFYIAEDIIPEVKKVLKGLDNVEVVEMKENKDFSNLFWRFIPMFLEKHYSVLSRDTDSRLNLKEKKAVDKWLLQDKDLLILRDHQYHKVKILGGMFGTKNNCLHKYNHLYQERIKDPKKGIFGCDQDFFNQIYDDMKDNSFIFDRFHFFKDEKNNKYSETEFDGYIGQIVCNDFKLTNEKYNKNLQKTHITKPYEIPGDSKV